MIRTEIFLSPLSFEKDFNFLLFLKSYRKSPFEENSYHKYPPQFIIWKILPWKIPPPTERHFRQFQLGKYFPGQFPLISPYVKPTRQRERKTNKKNFVQESHPPLYKFPLESSPPGVSLPMKNYPYIKSPL